jgi:hypothetical protein
MEYRTFPAKAQWLEMLEIPDDLLSNSQQSGSD